MAEGEDLSYVINDLQARIAALEILGIRRFATLAAATAATPNPLPGMTVYVDSNDANEGLWTYNGASWRAVSWNAPWGRIASAAATATTQTTITTVVDLTGISVTFIAVTRRVYHCHFFTFPSSSVTTDTATTLLTDGSNVQKAETQVAVTQPFTAPGFVEFSSVVGNALVAGSNTLKLRMVRNSGTGNVTSNGAAGFPILLAVSDVGPDVGAPV